MTRPNFVVSRRIALRTLAATAAAASLPGVARAEEATPDALLLTISDLHAPYARLPALLERFRTLRDTTGAPTAALINGDIFERGNVVCLRSGAAPDWAFLEALAREMPVVVNLGNHETAILDDMATFVARAEGAGIRVISNLVDRRTGRFFAPVSERLGLGGIEVALLGLATTNPFVYRPEVRDTLTFLDTAQFVEDAFAETRGDADLGLVMSHAGVSADKAFIERLPAGSAIQGAHDHVTLDVMTGDTRYVHGGSWGTGLGVLALHRTADGVTTRYRRDAIAPAGGDTDLADLIAADLDTHLTAEDREIVAEIPQDFDMHASILIATEAIRAATDADVAMLGHTTFGAPLTAGPLSRYDFDAFMRFGGPLRVARVPGAQLAEMMGRANQFTATDLAGRTGDYVHVATLDVDPAATYRLTVNAWTAMNQESYLGTSGLSFEEIADLELKTVVAAHLAARFGA